MRWQVTPEHPEGAFYRPGITGGEEVSPFTSAASGAYWVFVTATTVRSRLRGALCLLVCFISL